MRKSTRKHSCALQNDCVKLDERDFSCIEIILTNEIIAANNKILTKRSSNCSRISCHNALPAMETNNLLHFLLHENKVHILTVA